MNIRIEELNPTFLFTWKGNRDVDIDYYHSHEHIEIAYVMAGSGKYKIDGQNYDIKKGDLLILNPGVMHESLTEETGEEATTEFFVAFSDIKLSDYPPNYLPIVDGGHIIHTIGEFRQRIARLCAAMEKENTVCKEGRYFMLKSYLMQMILLVIREQSETISHVAGCTFETVNKKHVVEKMITYFQEHYSERISLDQIAENIYLSPFYISKIFKSEVGDTPIRYLINIRLEKARELLEIDKYSSIQEIAAKVGYEDAYHFSKLFKKRYGMSPSQVRKL